MTKSMFKLVTDNSAPTLERSQARQRLAALIAERTASENRLRALQEAGAKLREAADAERHAAAELAALDAEETQKMAAWSSQATPGPMPVFDQSRRQKLRAAVEAATAQAAAARKASVANGAEQAREVAAAKALEPAFSLAIAEIVAEAVDPLIDKFAILNRELGVEASKIGEALEIVTQLAEGVGNHIAARPVYVVGEKLHAKLRSVSGRPAPDVENRRAAWLSLAAKLRADPLAELED
jgi:hypothetical protein